MWQLSVVKKLPCSTLESIAWIGALFSYITQKKDILSEKERADG